MKKTLIALITLTGIASASTINAVNGTYSFDSSDWTKSTGGDYYTLTFAQPINLGLSDWEFSFTATINPQVGTNDWGTTIITSHNAPFPSDSTTVNGFQIWTSANGTTDVQKTPGTVVIKSNGESGGGTTVVGDNKALSAGTYTFKVTHEENNTVYSVWGDDGLIASTTKKTDWSDISVSSLITSIGGTYNNTNNKQLENNWELPSGSFRVIPEPTTATLSLLALAGLAARRRRK